jgi:hypothetical protein
MNRLVAFGCSHTAGSGLEFKEQSWTHVLSEKLGLSLVNNTIPGNSIKSIAYAFNNFKFQPNDTVIIGWTVDSRYSVIYEDTIINILPDCTILVDKVGGEIRIDTEELKELSPIYYRNYHDNYDSKASAELFIKFTDYHSTINNINLIHTFNDNKPQLFKLQNKVIDKPFYSTYRGKLPFSPDGTHLGPEANVQWAEYLYSKITDTTVLI